MFCRAIYKSGKALRCLSIERQGQSRNLSSPSLAKLIQQLRKATGAPMMECKKALVAEENNYDKATEWLRKNGSSKAASKLEGRDASEGLIGIALDQKAGKASLVKISSETDFASRSSDFQNLVNLVTNKALIEPDIFKLKNTVQETLDDAILAIRENLQISKVEVITASSKDSVLIGYIHGRIDNEINAGTAGALVELRHVNAELSKEIVSDVGKKLAMHIVAAKPSYQAIKDVPDDEIQKERTILLDQMEESGKPEDIINKIVDGRMRKYFEGICLEEQSHMLEDGNPKVSKALKSAGIQLVRFKSSYIQ